MTAETDEEVAILYTVSSPQRGVVFGPPGKRQPAPGSQYRPCRPPKAVYESTWNQRPKHTRGER